MRGSLNKRTELILLWWDLLNIQGTFNKFDFERFYYIHE